MLISQPHQSDSQPLEQGLQVRVGELGPTPDLDFKKLGACFEPLWLAHGTSLNAISIRPDPWRRTITR